MSAPKCSLAPCANTTTDPSGRCHHHRRASTAPTMSRTPGAPVPSSTPAPGPVAEAYPDAYGTEYVLEGNSLRPLPTDPYADFTVTCVKNHRYVDSGPVDEIRYARKDRAGGATTRLDGPAKVTHLGGTDEFFEYYIADYRPFRSDSGPTEVRRKGAEGRVIGETWKNGDDDHHRIGGPAVIRYDRGEGTVAERTFFRNGKLSRIDGPAVESHTHHDPSSYHLGGRTFDSHEGLLRAAASLSPATLRKHFTGTPFEEISRGREKDTVAALAAGITTPDGVAEYFGGAPVEWIRAFEESQS